MSQSNHLILPTPLKTYKIDCNTIAETPNFIVLDRYQRSSVLKQEYQSEDALEREFIQDLMDQGYSYETIRSSQAMLAMCGIMLPREITIHGSTQ